MKNKRYDKDEHIKTYKHYYMTNLGVFYHTEQTIEDNEDEYLGMFKSLEKCLEFRDNNKRTWVD